MELKIKKLTNLIVSILEREVCKVKLTKLVIAIALAVLLLDFTSWRESLTQALLIGLCVIDFEDSN